jgi:ribonuclease HII
VDRPVTRSLERRQVPALRRLFVERGHRPAAHPKNRHVEFEVRTDRNSIFTLYKSGKLVSTVRADDSEGQSLEAALSGEFGGVAGVARGTVEGLRWLAGLDETGTGELLGCAVVGGALLPMELADEAHTIAGHVDTKSSRAASGWETLGEQLAGLSPRGLCPSVLPIPNRLFDGWSKNGLLDLAYVRVTGDLLAAAGLEADDALAGLELVIDDYGIGALLEGAVGLWRERGARVIVQTRADDSHIAARLASVLARSHRSREMSGLAAEVGDGPLGTGNAGHPQTLAWLERRARSGAAWPGFVKTSFRTVRALRDEPERKKRRVPHPASLLGDAAGAAWLAGHLDVTSARLAAGRGGEVGCLGVDPTGRLLEPTAPCAAYELLPTLVGGLVLDDELCRSELLPALLDREGGLLSGWRLLVGPQPDMEDPALVALARAHRSGVITLVLTDEADPLERARRYAALPLARRRVWDGLQLLLRG